jgi:hypothetical protein
MKLAIVVLGNVLKLSPIVNIDFEFEKQFNIDNVNSTFDLPNLHITYGKDDSEIDVEGATIKLKKPIDVYMSQQLRKKSDDDLLGLYSSEDTIGFCDPDCENLDISIYYNVSRKYIDFDESECEYLIIVDNITDEVTHNGVINHFLSKDIETKCIITSNPNYRPPISCEVEILEC